MSDAKITMYPAIIIVDKRLSNLFSVEFPDLPGCFSQGNSIEEAILNAQEALAIYYHVKKGKIQNASNIFDIQRAYPDFLVQMISINPKRYVLKVKDSKVVKKNLTLPKWLHDMANKYDVNCSRLLKHALIEHLKNDNNVSSYDKMLLCD